MIIFLDTMKWESGKAVTREVSKVTHSVSDVGGKKEGFSISTSGSSRLNAFRQ